MDDWGQFFKNAAVEFWHKGKKRRGVLIDDVFEQDESCRVWFVGRLIFIRTDSLICGLGLAPSFVHDKTAYKHHLSWTGNIARLQGEYWTIRVSGSGSAETVRLELPQWARDVAYECLIPLVKVGRGNRARMKQTAQHIIDTAISTGRYPHKLMR